MFTMQFCSGNLDDFHLSYSCRLAASISCVVRKKKACESVGCTDWLGSYIVCTCSVFPAGCTRQKEAHIQEHLVVAIIARFVTLGYFHFHVMLVKSLDSFEKEQDNINIFPFCLKGVCIPEAQACTQQLTLKACVHSWDGTSVSWFLFFLSLFLESWYCFFKNL